MAEVMNSHAVEPSARTDAPPGMLQVSEVPVWLAARDHPWIVLIVGQ